MGGALSRKLVCNTVFNCITTSHMEIEILNVHICTCGKTLISQLLIYLKEKSVHVLFLLLLLANLRKKIKLILQSS